MQPVPKEMDFNNVTAVCDKFFESKTNGLFQFWQKNMEQKDEVTKNMYIYSTNIS